MNAAKSLSKTSPQQPSSFIVCGVSGCGKTTIGQELATELGWRFCDADDWHPQPNRDKMKAGIPLEDGDRLPWLETLCELLRASIRQQTPVVLACSALKRHYRSILNQADPAIGWIYLPVPQAELEKRLRARQHAFLNPALLDSQLTTLEAPDPAEALHVEPGLTPQQQVGQIIEAFGIR